jgi:16S rRNA (cytidine1402-2'-O)-methyltransferase
LIRDALAAGHEVVPVPGPSSVIAALVASGLPTHTFTFLGFLPRTSATRRKLLSQHAESETTLLVFESPHRVVAALKDMVATLGADRPIAIGRELTKHFEEIFRGTVSAALAHFEQRPPRGEFTLVIGGRSAPIPGSGA